MDLELIRKWATPVILLLIFLFGANIARADAHTVPEPSGWYFGGQFGVTEAEQCVTTGSRRGRSTTSCGDEDELATGIYFGRDNLFNMRDNIPVGFEVGYVDAGETTSGEETDAIYFHPTLRIEVFPAWNLVLFPGIAWLDNGDESDTVQFVGGGIERQWQKAFARLHIARWFEVKNDIDADVAMLGVGYRW